jgi:hypothetical protein
VSVMANFYWLKNLVFSTTCFGQNGHLKILHNIHKTRGRVVGTLDFVK